MLCECFSAWFLNAKTSCLHLFKGELLMRGHVVQQVIELIYEKRLCFSCWVPAGAINAAETRAWPTAGPREGRINACSFLLCQRLGRQWQLLPVLCCQSRLRGPGEFKTDKPNPWFQLSWARWRNLFFFNSSSLHKEEPSLQYCYCI